MKIIMKLNRGFEYQVFLARMLTVAVCLFAVAIAIVAINLLGLTDIEATPATVASMALLLPLQVLNSAVNSTLKRGHPAASRDPSPSKGRFTHRYGSISRIADDE